MIFTRKLSLTCLFVLLLSVSVAFASGGEGGEGKTDIVWRSINFLILVALLYWMLADKMKNFFSSRRAEIKDSISSADVAKKEAQDKYSEYVIKIDRASEEIGKIAEAIKAQGVAERDKIIENANLIAQKIKDDTKTRMEQEFNEASRRLRNEAVQLSVAMAEEILRRNVTVDDHNAMVKEYIDKVVVSQ
ncbi:MAG: F0F1 ATP synthase subunit B [Deltaproteobacteria bacterium]